MQSQNIYAHWVKNETAHTYPYLHQYWTFSLSSHWHIKSVTKQSLKIPPHHKCITTLPHLYLFQPSGYHVLINLSWVQMIMWNINFKNTTERIPHHHRMQCALTEKNVTVADVPVLREDEPQKLAVHHTKHHSLLLLDDTWPWPMWPWNDMFKWTSGWRTDWSTPVNRYALNSQNVHICCNKEENKDAGAKCLLCTVSHWSRQSLLRDVTC